VPHAGFADIKGRIAAVLVELAALQDGGRAIAAE
jgi:hypothetical protein